jgi:hypothetical protein
MCRPCEQERLKQEALRQANQTITIQDQQVLEQQLTEQLKQQNKRISQNVNVGQQYDVNKK